jgi:hypothetical protein
METNLPSLCTFLLNSLLERPANQMPTINLIGKLGKLALACQLPGNITSSNEPPKDIQHNTIITLP